MPPAVKLHDCTNIAAGRLWAHSLACAQRNSILLLIHSRIPACIVWVVYTELEAIEIRSMVPKAEHVGNIRQYLTRLRADLIKSSYSTIMTHEAV